MTVTNSTVGPVVFGPATTELHRFVAGIKMTAESDGGCGAHGSGTLMGAMVGMIPSQDGL